jgi:hypothetical protein
VITHKENYGIFQCCGKKQITSIFDGAMKKYPILALHPILWLNDMMATLMMEMRQLKVQYGWQLREHIME